MTADNLVTQEMVEAGAKTYLDAPEESTDKEIFGAIYLAMKAREPAVSGDMVERVAKQVKADPTEEPQMPSLAAHFGELAYAGGGQYAIECDCGFHTGEPGNYYVAKARWAEHAIAALTPNADAAKAETYEQMHETAKELGYPSILEALEDLDRRKKIIRP